MKRFASVALLAVFISPLALAAALSPASNLTAYHAASPAERSAVVPAVLAKVKDEIDTKGKSDADVAAEILPCMDSVDAQVSDADRATQTVTDLGAVCLAQLGFQKQ